MYSPHHNTFIPQAAPDGADVRQLLENRGGEWRRLHPEEVAISEAAMQAIHKAARQILARHVPFDKLEKVSFGDALTLLSSHIFWEEESGKLFLCSELGRSTYCLDVPADQWAVRTVGGVH